MKTPERIVQASLQLFNEQGERVVSTNHIAAYLEISPGNLYYHFANKQEIVAVLFRRYQAAMAGVLAAPAEGTVQQLGDYLVHLLEQMWAYRFFYQDLEHLLAADAELANRYHAFSQQCLARGEMILQSFVGSGVLVLSPREREALALNVWIVLTGWVRYCCTHGPLPVAEAQVVRRGGYQVLSLTSGFVAAPWREAAESLLGQFNAPLMMAEDQGPA